MNRQPDLSIFSFGEQQAKAGTTEADLKRYMGNSQITGTLELPKPCAASPAQVVVDLENLTPETLAAFFPSEHAAKR